MILPARPWAAAVLVTGLFCLVPVSVVTWMYYSHVLTSPYYSPWESGPALLIMSPLYVLMLVGPGLMVRGAITVLRQGLVSRRTATSIALGAFMTMAWAFLAVAARPPDLAVRIVSGVLLVASVFVAWSAVQRRRAGK